MVASGIVLAVVSAGAVALTMKRLSKLLLDILGTSE